MITSCEWVPPSPVKSRQSQRVSHAKTAIIRNECAPQLFTLPCLSRQTSNLHPTVHATIIATQLLSLLLLSRLLLSIDGLVVFATTTFVLKTVPAWCRLSSRCRSCSFHVIFLWQDNNNSGNAPPAVAMATVNAFCFHLMLLLSSFLSLLLFYNRVTNTNCFIVWHRHRIVLPTDKWPTKRW